MTVQELQSTQPITLDGHMPSAALVIIIQRLVKSHREQAAQIEAMQATIADHEARITALETP